MCEGFSAAGLRAGKRKKEETENEPDRGRDEPTLGQQAPRNFLGVVKEGKATRPWGGTAGGQNQEPSLNENWPFGMQDLWYPSRIGARLFSQRGGGQRKAETWCSSMGASNIDKLLPGSGAKKRKKSLK